MLKIGTKRKLANKKQKSNKKAKNEKGDQMIEYGEYKGNKLIILKRSPDDNYPFSFGKAKARLIVENFEAIKKFAEED